MPAQRLIDLHPQFLDSGGDGVSEQGPDACTRCAGSGCEACHGSGREYVPAPLRTGVGILLDCPCGNHAEDHQLYVPFATAIDGSPAAERGWQRTGETFETLTLTPSILRVRTHGGCGWHGFITNGMVTGQVE